MMENKEKEPIVVTGWRYGYNKRVFYGYVNNKESSEKDVINFCSKGDAHFGGSVRYYADNHFICDVYDD